MTCKVANNTWKMCNHTSTKRIFIVGSKRHLSSGIELTLTQETLIMTSINKTDVVLNTTMLVRTPKPTCNSLMIEWLGSMPRRLRHQTTLWKHHNVGWRRLTDVVMHLKIQNRCITTSVKRLQPTLWCFHNVVLCLNRRCDASILNFEVHHHVGFDHNRRCVRFFF